VKKFNDKLEVGDIYEVEKVIDNPESEKVIFAARRKFEIRRMLENSVSSIVL
jgi:hypothetical protein